MRAFRATVLIAAAGLIAGCGQKGPLMVPDMRTAPPVPVGSPVVESPGAAASAASTATPASSADAAASAPPPR